MIGAAAFPPPPRFPRRTISAVWRTLPAAPPLPPASDVTASAAHRDGRARLSARRSHCGRAPVGSPPLPRQLLRRRILPQVTIHGPQRTLQVGDDFRLVLE